jgi:hypothetical protein
MLTLLSLPPEIIESFARALHPDSDDFFNFRLVCKELNSKSFSTFVRYYFSTRYHMLSRSSLGNLIEISSHPIFGPALRKLVIGLDHLTVNPPPNQHYQVGSRIGAQVDGKAVINLDAYYCYLADQHYMAGSGLDLALLTRAMCNLPNCKTVRIDDAGLPWGAVLQKSHTGVFPGSGLDNGGNYSVLYTKRIIEVVLTAIIASQISLERFELVPSIDQDTISPNLFPGQSRLYTPLRPSQLPQVASLHILINPDHGEPPDVWAENLLNFLEFFPTLQDLNLEFSEVDEDQRLATLSHMLQLPCLRSLSISESRCSKDDLSTLFLNHKDTLKEIQLRNIDLMEGEKSWHSLEDTVRSHLSIEKFSHLDVEMTRYIFDEEMEDSDDDDLE